MSKILMLGFPLPSGNDREIVQARNIRALQFVEALAGEGHELIYAAKPQPHFDHRRIRRESIIMWRLILPPGDGDPR